MKARCSIIVLAYLLWVGQTVLQLGDEVRHGYRGVRQVPSQGRRYLLHIRYHRKVGIYKPYKHMQ